jgi:DNA-binding transcriptional MocR family regulator
MHVAAVARPGLNLERVADALLDNHVKIHTLTRYYVSPRPRQGLVFGYGVADLAQIERGLAVLRKALPK